MAERCYLRRISEILQGTVRGEVNIQQLSSMPKRKNLNGLPNDLTKSYFSTLNHSTPGYMADWLVNGAKKLGLIEATIDIINETIEPSELTLLPLAFPLKYLKKIIEKELLKNDFPSYFIVEAKIKVTFTSFTKHPAELICSATLLDQEGHKYECPAFTEFAYEKEFDPFSKKALFPSHKVSIFKSLFRWLNIHPKEHKYTNRLSTRK